MNDLDGCNDDDDHKSFNEQINQLNLRFVPSSDYIQTSISLGRGTYGYVQQAIWQGQKVAIKCLSRAEFLKEAEKLSRVRHENIIGVYGFTFLDNKNDFGFILEFADGGNLYNLLHANHLSSVHYTLSHAISWCLQCARGVKYLHSLNILHRDLKPSNLLLTNKCRTIKICDFGTARDKQTTMSANQGTLLWMAPEVFTTKNYSEKCDVFSWAIILWEVFTRQVPYQNIENNCAIMWAICTKGMRPPMIRDCPQIFRKLLTDCWQNDASKRPSMDNVVQIMEQIFSLCSEESQQEIDLLIPNDNFERLRISNITNPRSGNMTNSSSLFFDDYLHSKTSTSSHTHQGHKRSNSSDASIFLDQDSQESPQLKEDIQEIFKRYFNAYLFLPCQFTPPSPDIQNTSSMMIFEEHRKLALKLFTNKSETEYLINRIRELKEIKSNPILGKDSTAQYIYLTNEKRNLLELRSSFAKQLIQLLRDSVHPSQHQDENADRNEQSSKPIHHEEDWIFVDNDFDHNR
ncbi:hypothetical protein NH340_JMT08991 [Sarcoptes scabiei]|nr:hypothetical protein NH340_JMT08991 [Sarcoptes scabiei]